MYSIRVCERGAQFNVCADCVTGPRCIDYTEVTGTVFFALARLCPLYFSSPSSHFLFSRNHHSCCAQSDVQKKKKKKKNNNLLLTLGDG